MITDDLKTHDILKTPSTSSPVPAVPLERQVRELSERVFFDIQSLLRLSKDQAEETLASYQSLANTEIAHMEGIIERQQNELSVLQENLNRIQLHHRNMQSTHDAETNLLKDSIERYKEKELHLQQLMQHEKAEKMRLFEDNLAIQKSSEQQRSDLQQSMKEQESAFQHKLQAQREAYTTLQTTHEEQKAVNVKILERIKDDFDDQLKSAKTTFQQQMDVVKQAYQDDSNGLKTSYEDRIRKLESLLTLERENAKNKQQAWLTKCKSLEETYTSNLKRERELVQHQILQTQQQQQQTKETDLQAALAAKQKIHEKELAVLAQKKLTVEMNMKQLHKELIEYKRIISALRKKQPSYSEAL